VKRIGNSTLLLAIIACLLAVLAFRPVVAPPPAQAQDREVHHFYIEPGTTTVKSPDGSVSVLGKVVVDMATGDVWGFPTTVVQPYPVDSTKTTPPTSRPIYLGRFAFEQAKR
jgi:hypothetical protein